MKKLVDFLRETRLKLGYKQEYIAEKVGVASSTISRWENGTTTPNLTQVEAYANALQLDTEDLFASLANEEGKPQPIAEFCIEVFSKEVATAIMQVITDLSEKYPINSKQISKQYVERTSHLLQDIDEELEMSTKDLTETLMISESTLYRWRKKQLVRYRYTESGDVRFLYKSILIAVKSNRLRVSGVRNEELLGRLNRFKDNLIKHSCINCK